MNPETASPQDGRSPSPGTRPERRNRTPWSRKRRVATGIVVALLVILVASAWLGTRLLVAKNNLEASQQLVVTLQEQAAEGDVATMLATTRELQGHSSKAAGATGDVTWRIAEIIPVVGPNLSAVRAVAESIRDLVDEVAEPALATAESFDPARRDPDTGGFDLAPVDEAKTIAAAAGRIVPDSLAKLNAVDTLSVLDPVSAAVVQLRDVLEQVAPAAERAGPVVDVVGAILGADGPRNYLLAFQNNAESTALGGSAASYIQMHSEDGAITVADVAGSGDFGDTEVLPVPVDDSALSLFGDFLVDHINTSTSRPDFPTAATLLQGYWERDRGPTVDGVVSVDPLALAQILKATGPVDLPSGDVVSSDNAVQLLVNEIYFRYDSYAEPEVVDAFFQGTAAMILEKITSGDFDVPTMVTAISDSINNGNLMLWSADAAEQAAFDGARIQGVLPKSNTDETVVGVYFRDTSSSKIDYYMHSSAQLSSDVCTNPQNPTFTTSATLTLDLDQDFADELPLYVKSAPFGSSQFRTEIFVYGPVGGTVVSANGSPGATGFTVPGAVVTGTGIDDLGRPVATFATLLAPGETTTVDVSFSGAPGTADGYGPLELRGTPMIRPTERTVDTPGCDG